MHLHIRGSLFIALGLLFVSHGVWAHSSIENIESKLETAEIPYFTGPYSREQLTEVWTEIQNEWFLDKAVKSNTSLYNSQGLAKELHTYDGKTYPNQSQQWSDFEKGLLYRLKYPGYVNFFLIIFNKHIVPAIDRAILKDKRSFTEYIQRKLYFYAFVMASKKVPAYNKLKSDRRFLVAIKTNPELDEAFKDFFQDLQSFFPVRHKKDQQKKILILTSSGAGGGHLSVAQAIESYLSSSSNYAVKTIDTRKLVVEDPKKADVLLQVTGKLHSEDIFNEILQKRSDISRAQAYWSVLSDLKNYIPDYSIENLVQVIQKEDPDLIISCLHHRPEYVFLSYALDIPQLIVSTDYSLQENLYRFVQIADPQLVKILTSNKDQIFFEDFYYFLRSLQKQGNESFDSAILTNLDLYLRNQMNWNGFKKVLPIFDYMGIPIREEIEYNRSPDYIKSLRDKYRVPDDHRVITIAMGRQGAGEIQTIVDLVEKGQAQLNHKITFLVLCGENEKLYSGLSSQFSESKSKSITIIPLKSQNAAQISGIYNISDALISKPGGITTDELVKTHTPLIAYSFYPWEKPNLQKLIKIGLGFEPKSRKDIVETINQVLAAPKPTPVSKDSEKWKTLLGRNIEKSWVGEPSISNVTGESEKTPKISIPYINQQILIGKRKSPPSEARVFESINKKISVEKKPHIFFVFVDTLRNQNLNQKDTPNIIKFAEESAKSKYSIASATATHHSTFSIFHSRLALERTYALMSKWSSGSPFLRILKDQLGYQINLFGLTHLLFKLSLEPKDAYELKPDKPFFLSEESNVLLNFSSGSSSLVHFAESDQRTDWYTKRNGWNKRAIGDGNTIEAVKSYLSQDFNQHPSFNFVYFFATHDPYNWPDDLIEHQVVSVPYAPNVDWWDQDFDLSITNQKSLTNSYMNAVRGIDYQFKKFLDVLKEKGIYDESLIVFLSDHGEYLWELNHFIGEDGQPWRASSGHGGDGYSYLSDVPIFYKLPASSRSPHFSNAQAQISDHTDVMPTIFDILGVAPEVYSKTTVGESIFAPKRKTCKITSNPNMDKIEQKLVFNNGKTKAFVELVDYASSPMEAKGIKVRFLTDLHDRVITLGPEEQKSYFESEFYKDFDDCIRTIW